MHMWHHVTNHLIISNDKDFNSENRIKLRVRDTRRLYISIAIPRILYAVDVWGIRLRRSAKAQPTGKISECNNKLTSVQRAGTLAITGGLRTSPTDALDAHAFTLPLHLETEKHLFRSAIRIAMLAPQHPLHKPAKCHDSGPIFPFLSLSPPSPLFLPDP
jgi:hypothetical protein